MCNNTEINEALLKKRGYRQYEGNKQNLSPIMYFFLMDAAKQIFDGSVGKQECSGQQKVMMTRMQDGFHFFFKDFFSAFNQEQTDFIIDKADEFEEQIAHHLEIAEIAIQECVNNLPIERQREISKVWLCNLLAADAQDFHGECWKTGGKQPLKDRYIEQVVNASKLYSKYRFGDGPIISEKQFGRVQASVKVIAKKTVNFLYQDYLREIGQHE